MDAGLRCAELYDLAVTLKEDIPLYVDILSGTSGGVAEVGCGTGRITIPLARSGLHVFATDISEGMIQVATRKLVKEARCVQSRVCFIVADMAELDAAPVVDAILAPYNVLKYKTSPVEQIAFLKTCRSTLPPAGRLVLHCDVDSFDPAALLNKRVCTFEDRTDPVTGNRVSSFHTVTGWDVGTQVVTATVEYVETVGPKTTATWRRTAAMRLLANVREVLHLVAAAGLKVTDAWGHFDRTPLTDDARKVILVAAR